MSNGILQNAWEHLGGELPEGLTAREVLYEAKLANWDVRKVPLHASVGGVSLPVDDQFAVVRNNPDDIMQTEVLGTVGRNYHVLQNDKLEWLLDILAKETSAEFSSAGSLYGGRQVFVTMRMSSTTHIRGSDKVEHYLSVLSSHDGSLPTMIMASPVRTSGQGLMNVPLGRHSNIYRFRHTAGASRITMVDVEIALSQLFNFYDEFDFHAERLAKTEMNRDEFEDLLLREFGPGPDSSSATVTRREDQIETMMECFYRVSDHELIENSAWAGYSALVDWSDHVSPVRGGGVPDQDVRARKAILDPWFKEQALKIIQASV